MKNLKLLSDEVLLGRCDRIVRVGNKITKLEIEHFAEVDRRRLYLASNSSLFEWLRDRYNYTNGSVQRRIDAIRLSQEVLEVPQMLESGSLNLDQVRQIQQASRQSKKRGRTVEVSEKKAMVDVIVNTISGTSKSEEKTEIFIAKSLDLPVEKKSKKKHHGDESITREDHYTQEENEIIQKAWDLVSHSVPSLSFKEFVLYLAKRVIAQKTQAQARKKTEVRNDSAPKVEVDSKSNAKAETNPNSAHQMEEKNKTISKMEVSSKSTPEMESKSSLKVEASSSATTKMEVKSNPATKVEVISNPTSTVESNTTTEMEGKSKVALARSAKSKAKTSAHGSSASTMEVKPRKYPSAQSRPATTVGVAPPQYPPAREAIPRHLYQETLNRDRCCQQKLAHGQICGSTRFLQVDHITPIWAGGTNAPENLRALCGAHNRERYLRGK